jgi:hypothetical protein
MLTEGNDGEAKSRIQLRKCGVRALLERRRRQEVSPSLHSSEGVIVGIDRAHHNLFGGGV